ncbi:NAD(P)-dependent oxidoreductase [Azospirillum oleiclasticum]|uniref:NAD(P)-dependent oxidoreductase n=1 Tax=Azospirillum oleiclasticum TaxID=2735135 RepID=UPI0031B5BACC
MTAGAEDARPDLSGWRVGVIGLGLMGRPMARNLARAGAGLVVHSRSPGPVEELAHEGMEPAADPAGVAAGTDTVILMLTDSAAVEAVVEGPRGLLEGLRPGALVIDMGTTAVPATRRLAVRVAEAGCAWVDAPVSGGTVAAEAGTLTVMAGGADADVERAMPLFRALGARITHVGGTGTGQVAKAANQVIVGLTIGAVAEALALARAAGADPARVRDAIRGGFAESRILELHGGRMVSGDFTPGARATVQLKDMRQAEQLAAELGVTLPAVSLGRELYESLVGRGDGGLDHAALYRLFETSPR